MARIVILLSFIIPFLFIQARSQNKPFVSSEGRFSIDLPGPPMEEKNSQEAAFGGKKLGWRNEGVLFTVSYVDVPNAKTEDAEAVVAASADAYVGLIPKAAEIVSKIKITLDGFPGLEVRSREKDGFTVIARYYMVEKRAYCLVAMWTAGLKDEYVVKTLDSFKAIKPAPVH
jgi:hypothetical protein